MIARASWRRLLFGIYAAVLLTLTHLPPAQVNRIPIKLPDKPEHLIAYFLLGLLGLWSSLRWPAGRTWIGVVGPIAALLLFGAVDEWTQPIFGRACELSDWASDSLGVLLAAAVIWLTRRRAARKLSDS